MISASVATIVVTCAPSIFAHNQTIRHELEGNLCRCTGYHNIVKAIAAGARAMGAMDAMGPGHERGAGKRAAE